MNDEISKFADDTKFFQRRNGKLEHCKIQVYKLQHGNTFGKKYLAQFGSSELSVTTQERDLEMFCPEWNLAVF